MDLIITCTHKHADKCSSIRFWLKEAEEPKSLIFELILPIQSARQSLALFNSKHKPEFEHAVQRIQKIYNISPENTFSFTDSPKIKASYLRMLDKLRHENMELSQEERDKARLKRQKEKAIERKKATTVYQREYKREYRRLEKLKQHNPELYGVLKNKK